jgi:hypothetical protein
MGRVLTSGEHDPFLIKRHCVDDSFMTDKIIDKDPVRTFPLLDTIVHQFYANDLKFSNALIVTCAC